MSELRDLEQKTFRTARDDGLWDVLIGSVVSMFAVAPLLSDRLGDFWSSALFVPVWLGVYVAIRLFRTHVVQPRVGIITLGAERRARMRRGSIVLLIINTLAFVLGALAAFGIGVGWLGIEGSAYPIFLGLASIVLFSVVAYVMRIWRFAVYGLLLAVGPIVGEWMWRRGWVEHHGFPIVFGMVALVMVVVGLTRLMAVMRAHSLPRDTAGA
jgi:hypothetical protein